jgi:hypothetical protein
LCDCIVCLYDILLSYILYIGDYSVKKKMTGVS